jgi:GTP-binding protein YchF
MMPKLLRLELILSDLESVEKRLPNMRKKYSSGDKSLKDQIELLEVALECLSKGDPVRKLINKSNAKAYKSLQLLTSKPILYICNVAESEASTGNQYSKAVEERAKSLGIGSVIISSKIESEISLLDSEEEKAYFLESIGLEETGLSKIAKASYALLNMQSYFTIGPKEAHAWTFEIGTLAPGAAGIIHTDFEKGFIRAEVISYSDYIACQGEVKAKETGKMRVEGKEYVVQDGDVVHFRFNV